MKRAIFLLCLLLIVVFAKAQFTKLHDFDGVGKYPVGGLVSSVNDTALYGVTQLGGGGSGNNGRIYSIHPDGTGFRSIFSFGGADTVASGPYGSVTRVGNKLYGTSYSAGRFHCGLVFSMNTDGSGYRDLYDFPGVEGKYPSGDLIVSGGLLFGTTAKGGLDSTGIIYSIHTDGTGFKKLWDYQTSGGIQSGGELILSGNVLYAQNTPSGGLYHNGFIFSIDTTGNGFTTLMDFTPAMLNPENMVKEGNMIFGVGNVAGGKGYVFSMHTDGSGFKHLHDFSYSYEALSLMFISGNTLGGFTGKGGLNDLGTIFTLDTSGTIYRDLVSFSPSGGDHSGPLILLGDTLYASAALDGDWGYGTVYSMKLSPPNVPLCMVTVNDSSSHNRLVWEKPRGEKIDSFILFRETMTDSFRRIGAVPFSALGEFEDTVATHYLPYSGKPNAGANRYKLQVRDSAGHYSQLSSAHTTLFLSQAGGTFNWNLYTIEGNISPLPVITGYTLSRDDNSTGLWHQVAVVSGTQTTATDPNFSSYPNGSWRVETVWSIPCSSTATTYSSSKSNRIGKGLGAGIESYVAANPLVVSPNPANSLLTVSGIAGETVIRLIDVLGKTVLETRVRSNATLDISQLAEGIYTLVADGPFVRTVHKIVVSK
jgi:hypothetical protein